jgi:hypothetical protein
VLVNWLTDHWLDLLGWGGSALLVTSLLQTRVLRFRFLNLVACSILVTFNALLAIWPMVAMNIVLFLINLWFIVKLLRDRHDEAAFEVLEMKPDDTYLRYVLRMNAADIASFQPDFDPTTIGTTPGSTAYLVQKGAETVGVVVLEMEGDTAYVRLDYVTPRYRDFSPGEFVWRSSGLLVAKGLHRVVTPPKMVDAYYGDLGFHREGGSYVLDLRDSTRA